jgi:hypothetical protein
MGHQRLGEIPKTQRWNSVVAKVTGEGSPAEAEKKLQEAIKQVAAETLAAAEGGLDTAISDGGLRFTFYILTQVVLAAREDDWQTGLADQGIKLSPQSSVLDLTLEVQRTIDEHVLRHGRPTTVSEIAQKAAGEAITSLAAPKAATLFGSGRDELQQAIHELSTKKGFSSLGQKFFGCFMARYLNFYLSRVTAQQVGGPRLPAASDLTAFNEALQTHCHQSARIVRDFCGEWYSKTEFQKGIDLENTSGFMAIAIKKLRAELKKQREGP